MANTTTSKAPKIQSGGSLMLAWQVRNKPILIIGGGEVAASRITHCLNADAVVTVISPLATLHPEVKARLEAGQITHIDRVFSSTDISSPPTLTPPVLVLSAVDDPSVGEAVHAACAKVRVPCNVADVPNLCDFYFGSVHRDGPLQVMVSTGGNGPRLASLVRKWIGGRLPKNCGAAIMRVGLLRRKLRSVAPGLDEGAKRMSWMSKVCDKWSLEELCELTEEDMDELLKYYKSDKVPTLQEVRGKGSNVLEFDGSFGWWI